MAVDPDFGDRVVVTSSSTRVDTDELVGAALGVRTAAAAAREAASWLGTAGDQCGTHAALVPSATSVAVQAVGAAAARVWLLVEDLEGLAESLAFAALVYVAADGDARHFESVWHALRPGTGSWWGAGLGSVHTRGSLRGMVPWGLGRLVPGRVVDMVAGPVVPWLGVGMAVGGHAGDFLSGNHADGTEMMRTQLDVEALSALVDDHTFLVGAGEGEPPRPGGASWWGERVARTGGAASIGAAWMFGVGRLWKGTTAGVAVGTRVPNDTLDMSTGRPTGWRWTEATAASDRVGDVAVAAGADPWGATWGLGLAASAAALAPVPQVRPVVSAVDARAARTATPRAPSDLIGRIGALESSPAHGQVEVLRHSTPRADGSTRTSWSVVIRGTQRWTPGGANPQDMLTNLQGVAGQDSDQTRAVRTAMEMAGIGVGEPVEFAGHSQGAIVAAQLAADPEVASRYRVVSVLTAGGPTGGSVPAGGARMLSLENTRDPVPALDGIANRDLRGSATVYFDGGAVHPPGQTAGGAGPHDMAVYREAMAWLEQESDGGAGSGAVGGLATGAAAGSATREVTDWIRARERALGLGEATSTSSMLFDTRRIGAAE